MFKKIFSVFFAILTVFSVSTAVFAYEPNGFSVSANAGILVSLDTGDVLFEKNIDKKLYPASITKIMTSLVMLESDRFDPDGKLTMTDAVEPYITGTGSVVSSLKVGEEFSQRDLLYLILMSSAGDCAYLAALYYGDTVENFVGMMNDRAQSLGMTGTHYANPVGLHDAQNYTTVQDIRTLTAEALKHDLFREVCEATRYQIPATNFSGTRTISTTNFLQDNTTNYYYPYAKGVKTGYTDEAGRCLVSTAEYNGYRYLCILMGCPANKGIRYEFKDSRELYRWAFNDFEFKQIADADNPICEVKVELSLETDHLPVYVENGFISVLPKNADTSTVIIKPHLISETMDAPVKKGQVLGTAEVIYAEQMLGTVNLVAGDTVKSSGLLIAVRTVKRVFSSIYMKLVYAAIGIAVVIFFLLIIKMNSGRRKKRKVKYIPYDERKDRKS